MENVLLWCEPEEMLRHVSRGYLANCLIPEAAVDPFEKKQTFLCFRLHFERLCAHEKEIEGKGEKRSGREGEATRHQTMRSQWIWSYNHMIIRKCPSKSSTNPQGHMTSLLIILNRKFEGFNGQCFHYFLRKKIKSGGFLETAIRAANLENWLYHLLHA